MRGHIKIFSAGASRSPLASSFRRHCAPDCWMMSTLALRMTCNIIVSILSPNTVAQSSVDRCKMYKHSRNAAEFLALTIHPQRGGVNCCIEDFRRLAKRVSYSST